jgi:membrane-associated phospholipid phosphatase
VDGRIAVWLATHRVALLDDPAVWLGTIDKLGAVWVALALLVGAAARLGVARTLALGALAFVATFTADSLSFLVKDVTDRARPFEAHPSIHPLYTVHSSSFPAGHASTAFAGAVLLAFVAPRVAPFVLALAAAIAVSRVYVGVHYPTDVLAGALIGAPVGAVAAFVAHRSGLTRAPAHRSRFAFTSHAT